MCLDLSVFMIHVFTVPVEKKIKNLWGSFQLQKGKKKNLTTTQAKK